MVSTDVALSLLDILVPIVLVQILLTGIYAAIFCQAIVRLVRTGQHKIYATVLAVLFVAVVTHSGTNFWELRRDIFIVTKISNEKGLFTTSNIGNLAAATSVSLGDVLLLWRCYILWMRNKILLFIFVSVMLGQSVVLILAGFINIVDIRRDSLIVAILMFVSLGTTIVATVLIIYRIHDMTRGIDGASSRYNFTVKVLVESGALYAVALVLVCIFLVIRNKGIGPQGQGIIYWVGLATPMAGIAPTLIALRITKEATRDTSNMIHAASSLQFNRPLAPMVVSLPSVMEHEQC